MLRKLKKLISTRSVMLNTPPMGEIRHAMDELALAGVTAETDDDAVGFYEHFGFTVTVCEEIYNDVPCRRYFCEYSC